MNIHERVRKIRTEHSLTIQELSKLLETPDRTISNYERGERKPSVDYLILLAEKLQANPEWLILGKGEMFIDAEKSSQLNIPKQVDLANYRFIPYYDLKAAAGDGSIIDDDNIKDYIAFTKEWLSKNIPASFNNLIILIAKGDSMDPTIKDGDLLIVDTTIKDSIKNDGIYIIRMDDYLVVKRLQRLHESKLAIMSDNPRYKSYEIDLNEDANTGIVGQVVWFGRQFSCL